MKRRQLLTSEQAFNAMSVFVERYYARTGGAGDMGSLLGDIQINPADGSPFDPAISEDWADAVKAVLEHRIASD